MGKPILYSIGCPMCNVLKKKLIEKNIDFELCDDVEVMKEKGFLTAPKLEVGSEVFNFKDAIEWVKKQ